MLNEQLPELGMDEEAEEGEAPVPEPPDERAERLRVAVEMMLEQFGVTDEPAGFRGIACQAGVSFRSMRPATGG